MASLALRQNLQIQKAPAEHGGQLGWLLHDPVTSRYFKVGARELEFLRYISGLQEEKSFDEEDVNYKQFLSFLSENNLLSCDNDSQRKLLKASVLKKNTSKGMKAIFSQYLSLRIPLFRSDAFLTALVSVIRPFLRWPLLVVLLSCAFAGIYMTVNQWGRFSNTFFEMISPSGFSSFVIALVFVKIIHELGHGVVAKYYGCYVPTIGVTFLVFWPVLYTDTSAAWLLPSYRQRFMIALSGMLAEIIIACIALFFWHFLPSGLLKSTCFLLATTTLVLSLVVNLNPLMRFDGYFLLSDWWKMDNLMQRSLALRLWFVRRFFWGLEIMPPEQPQTRIVIYGWCCWIYRLSLIVAVSLVVYHFVYKPLGVVLMVSMIVNSIVKPIFGEVKFIVENIKNVVAPMRFILSIISFLLLCLFLIVPMHSRLSLPAVIGASTSQKIYMPFDGQLIEMVSTVKVKAGESLYKLHVPDLFYQLKDVDREQERLQWQLNQFSIGGQYFDSRPKIKSELLAVTKKRNELQQVIAQSNYLVPFSGLFQLRDDARLKVGDWIQKGTLLGTLIDNRQIRVDAYLPEQERDLLKIESSKNIVGTFYPDNGVSEPIDVLLQSVSAIAIQQLNHPELASINGGVIRVNKMENNTLVPTTSYYSLHFSSSLIAPNKQISGEVVIHGESHSLIGRIWLHIVALFRKETDI